VAPVRQPFTPQTDNRRWQRASALVTIALFLAFLILRRGRLW